MASNWLVESDERHWEMYYLGYFILKGRQEKGKDGSWSRPNKADWKVAWMIAHDAGLEPPKLR